MGLLGQGGFAIVERVRYKRNLGQYCLKIMDKSMIQRRRQLEHVTNERNILMACDHPFIVKLLACFFDAERLYFLMEYASGGDLHHLIRRLGRLGNGLARFYAAEVVLALRYLHDRNVAHRDIKPENIVLDSMGHIKLVDFGFAKHIRDRSFSICGTPEYMAPEVFLSKGHSKAVDWWALGVLIYEMLCGGSPFVGADLTPFNKVLEGHVTFPKHFDPQAVDLISKLLSISSAGRLGNLRGGAADVMEHPWFAGLDWSSIEAKLVAPPHPFAK
jgi:protein kinase X